MSGATRSGIRYNPAVHRRRSIRPRRYDYARPRAYFVTVCTHHRVCWFGTVEDGAVALNDAGRVVEAVWEGLARRFPMVGLDELVVMPNHIHGIITVGARFIAPSPVTRAGSPGRRRLRRQARACAARQSPRGRGDHDDLG